MEKNRLLFVVLAALNACAPAQPNIAPPTSADYIPPATPAAERVDPTLTTTIPTEIPTVIYSSPQPTRTLALTRIPTATASPPAWCRRTLEMVGTPEPGHEHVVSFGSSFTYWFLYWLNKDKTLAEIFDGMDISGRGFPGESAQQIKTRFIENHATIRVTVGRRNILLLQPGAIDIINLINPTTVLDEIERNANEIHACFPEFELVVLAPIPNKINNPAVQLNFATALETRMGTYGWRVSNPGPLLVAPDGRVKGELYEDDLHLKPEGYKLIAPIMRQAIIGAGSK